ncbi:MAG: LytR C-terminal domain-containing protein [Solirubrobacterales bacterium]
MEVSEVFDRVTGFAAIAALLAIALLLPLYLSQRRDVQRMRAWMEREPGHPASDIAASEAILDHAETELEELLGTAEPETSTPPSTPVPAATRVTHERPALERITMERAALEAHPGWRRFVNRASEPRVLIAIGVAALLLGGAGIYVSEEILRDGGESEGQRVGAIDRADVTVAVLNGTSVNGLAGNVGSDVESSGYELGPVSSTTPGFAKTVVLYDEGQKRAAQKVARDLGVDKATVEELDRETRGLAGGADVVVIAGEDRAS